MACEVATENAKGVKIKKTEGQAGINRVDVIVTNDIGAQSLGKPKGRYITIEARDIYTREIEVQHYTAQMLAGAISDCIANTIDGTVLVVGLGNKNMTADALGSRVIDKMIVTRHMYEQMSKELDREIGSLCALAPGVLGITGIETYDIIKGVVDNIKPRLVITVDSLASRSTKRLSSAFQVTNTGIVPGAGVGNHRFRLCKETLGVPVISVGVPLVVYASTLSLDILTKVQEDKQILNEDSQRKIIDAVLNDNLGEMVVTPKDIDDIVEKCAYIVAIAINLAVHRKLRLDDVIGCIR